MRLGTIGGGLLIASCLLFAASTAIALVGGTFGAGTTGGALSIGSLVMLGAIALGGLGAGIIGIGGPLPLRGRAVRVGLVAVSIGLLALTASNLIAATMTYDPLESGPFVIAFLVGGLGIVIGMPLTLVSLLLTPGRARRLGALFLAGIVITVATGMIFTSLFVNGAVDFSLFVVLATGMGIAGASAMILAVAGLALLAMTGSRADALVGA